MKLTKKLEARVLKAYNDCWDAYLRGDLKEHGSFLSREFRIIGTSGSEEFNNKKEWLAYCKKTLKQFTGVIRLKNRKIKLQPVGDEVMVSENSDLYVLIGKKWNFYSKVRITALLQKEKDGWKYVHQHGSLPDTRANEGEVIATEQIKKENLQLRDAVKRRTAELQEKNNELEIEAALERVRTVAMSMRQRSDMLEVCKTIAQQLKKLSVKEIRNVQTAIFYEERKMYTNYEYYEKHKKKLVTDVDYSLHKEHLNFANKMLKGAGQFYQQGFRGKKLKDWYAYQQTTSQFADSYLEKASSLNYYMFSLGKVVLGLSTYAPLNEPQVELFRRFIRVFELAYQRYTDIEQAEMQAKEAQTQLALERVRARTMAMQKSDELAETAVLLFHQLISLGLDLKGCGFNIWAKQEKICTAWMSGPEGALGEPFHLPLTEDPLFVRYYESRQNGEDFWVYETGQKELITRYHYLSTLPGIGEKLKKEMEDGVQLPPFIVDHVVNFSNGNLIFITYRRCPEAWDIFKRFGKVFEQTYTRFLDLQKAEAQAKEAQIQLALERVRASTMAMQKSDELADTANILFQQLKELGESPGQISIGIVNEKDAVIEMWVSMMENPKNPVYKSPISEPNVIQKNYQAWKKQVKSFVIDLTGKEMEEYMEFRRSYHGIESQDDNLYRRRVIHVAPFSKGMISLSSHEPRPAETLHLLERFAAVFDLTYTRFLDLQKAEAQVREAKIEAALERVRSRSLAMHKSDELSAIAKTMFEQLRHLGLELEDGLIIMLFREGSRDQLQWPVLDGVEMDTMFTVPYFDDPVMNEVYKAREAGVKFIERHFDKASKDDFLEKIFSITDYKVLPVEFQEKNFAAPYYHYSFAMEKFTGILMHSYSRESYPAEYNDILKRFTRVFEQAYVRFLDLQKAEEQAREAQVQLALERVRARTMAMQKSDELREVSGELYHQLKALGEPAEQLTIGVIKEDENVAEVSATLFGSNLHQTFRHSLDEPIVMQKLLRAWKAGQRSMIIDISGKELEEYNRFRNELTKSSMFPVNITDERRILYIAFYSKGTLALATSQPRPEESLQLLERFANVFDGTFTRFLDLQKAETQAREAEIELGLERVRARAMAMQNSDELKELIGTVFTELTKLDLTLTRCIIWVFEPATNAARWWMANGEEPSNPISFYIKYHEHPAYLGFVNAWKEQSVKYAYDLNGQDKASWDDILFNDTELVNLPDVVKNGMRAPERVLLSASFNNFGGINTASLDPLSEEHFDILLRFAKVFDLTYTRFLDLKKAEAQAREAQIEAGLERVRYSAMAMQSSEDVGSASAVVFNEISLLGVEAMRCGITVIHPDKTADVWAATATTEGKEMKGMGSINFNDHPLWVGLFEAWKNKEEAFSYALSGDDLRSYYKALADSPNYNSSYIQSQEFPDHFFYACCFEQGAVFTFSRQPHTDEKRKVLKRFTAVFSLTFRRYLDLQQAEAQAREAKIEASLERVRSKAMAMHSSQDLADTIGVFYNELHSFSITPRRCGVGLLDKEERIGEMFTWNTTEEGHSLELVGKLKMKGHPVLDGVYEHWLSQTEYHPVLRGNEIKEYYQILRPQMNFPDYTHDEVQYGYFFFFREGGVYAWTQQEMKEDELQIYRRFTSVLSLTYKRYKDLQQAESNAREAQIEAALERVRSRTLAMQKSDELAETASEVFRQLISLGIEPNRLYIGIMNPDTRDMEMWATDEDGTGVGKKFTFNAGDNESVGKLYDGWVLKKKSVTVEMQGTELQSYIHYLQQLQIPMSHALTQKRRVQNVAYFDKGFIGMASPDEQSGKSIQLLERFAAVFNLTFTRFNDLKIAEAHALQAEEDLVKLHEEKRKTEEALAELQSTQRQLIQSEKMASLGELTAGIAHEIQNPLNFVNNFSEVSNELLDEMMEEVVKGNYEEVKEIVNDVKQNLEKINHHGKRADGIVKGMLQHSRAGSGQKELTDINALADEYLRLAYHGLRAKDKSFNAKFETEFDNSIGRINIIPQDIGRVILNLINNAFYAVSQRQKSEGREYEPTVIVSTEKAGDKVLISVKDNGTGIPQKALDKIFQPFFTTKPTGQGTGLGLSLAYDIITKGHGGEIKAETKEGEGSVFIIQLPTV